MVLWVEEGRDVDRLIAFFSTLEMNESAPFIINSPIQFVVKWIDYSNKYGFGFQLSDRSVGVLFNDYTKIGLSPDKR